MLMWPLTCLALRVREDERSTQTQPRKRTVKLPTVKFKEKLYQRVAPLKMPTTAS